MATKTTTQTTHSLLSFAEIITAEDDDLKAVHAAGMSQATKRIDALSSAFTKLSHRHKSLARRIEVAQNFMHTAKKSFRQAPGSYSYSYNNGSGNGTTAVSTEYALAMSFIVATEATAISAAAEAMFFATKSRIVELRYETDIGATLEYFWFEAVEEFARFNDVADRSLLWLALVGDFVPPIARLGRLQL